MSYQQGSMEGLPAAARDRLARMRGTGSTPAMFTSDLSVNEFLLVREAGFEPLGMVVGSSIYHIGFQFNNINQNQEMGVLTQAMYEARELAMTRMEEEADILGADGVVGVRLEINRYAWGPDIAEFMAIGTAIKHVGGGPYRTVENRPFTSDLSGQDFWTLLKAGFKPVSLAMGACVYHVARLGLAQSFKQMGRNVEIPTYTQAIYAARELAMSRMQSEAERLQAHGIVGMQISESNQGWDSNVVEYFALGTAVQRIEGHQGPPEPGLVLPLTN